MTKLDQMIKRAKRVQAWAPLVDESETFRTRLTYEVEVVTSIS